MSKYYIIAGEASGDLHGGELIRALRKVDSEADFVFLGGDKMAEAAGTAPRVHISEMAFMGFSEVLRNLGKVRRNLAVARKLLRDERPDCLILIDYPSFNLKVAETAKKAGIKVYYYISPKVWAWKEWRVRTIKRLVDKMFVIFPFEVPYYADRHHWDVEYVGNPSVREIDRALTEVPPLEDFRREHKLPSRPVIALLPGSRRGEIRNNLGVMLSAAKRFVQYRPVIAGAPGIEPSFYAAITDAQVVYGSTVALLRHSTAALVTSGTATLEAALAGTPQVACYRSNGSKITYNIMKRLLKVPYVTLPNLIAGRQVIPEMLLHLCKPEAVAEILGTLTPANSSERRQMLEGYSLIRRILGDGDAAMNTARGIRVDIASASAGAGTAATQ